VKSIFTRQVVIFGEVLFDNFPDGRQILGGAPFNVAWHLQAFNAKPLLISRIGADSAGDQIKSAMQKWGMTTEGLQLEKQHPSGQVSITFNDGEPEYDIVANSAYDYIDANFLPKIANNCIIYHGSLALRNQTSLRALKKIKQISSAKSFVDINLRSPWWCPDLINNVLDEAHWLKVNDQEFSILSTISIDSEKLSADSLLTKKTLEMILLTRGSEGAEIVCKDGSQYQIKPESKINVVDTVGAGDAFSSIILLGLLKHWPISVMLQRAQDFASAIVGIRGAISLDTEFYQKFIEAWKIEYE
jgi:fructokinase